MPGMRSRWTVRHSCGHDAVVFTDEGTPLSSASLEGRLPHYCGQCRANVTVVMASYEGDEPDDGPVRIVSMMFPTPRDEDGP